MKKRITSLFIIMVMLISFIPALQTQAATVATSSSIKIGDYIQMGKYYNDPILWRCVDIDENGPLMLADKILTIKAFDATGNHKYLDGTDQPDDKDGVRTKYYGSNLWETSTIRSWLNSTASAGDVIWLDGCPPTPDKMWCRHNPYVKEKGFLAEGNFTVSEQNAIKSVKQKSLLNVIDVKLREGGTTTHTYSSKIDAVVQNYDTAYSHMVTDKMFLLDVKQLNKVYQNSSTLGTDYWIGTPTQKAVDNSDYKSSKLAVGLNWNNWTRCPSADSIQTYAVRIVDSSGSISQECARYYIPGARPAFYINLSSEIFKFGNGSIGTPYSITKEDSSINIAAVSLNKTTTTLTVGGTDNLVATISPVTAINKAVTWTISDTTIAKVDTTGKVTALKPGTATITVTTADGGKLASCEVTVMSEIYSTFSDKNLEQVIRDEIKKPTGNILKSDVEKITSLKASEKNITNLSGIENLTNLTSLNLSQNQISDISVLGNLRALNYLNLNYNQISNISVLENLNALNYLHLYNNQISNIESLKGLTKLVTLELDSNQISDISVLGNLKALNSLTIANNKISTIESLKELTKLYCLYIANNQITDISVLENFKDLSVLWFSGNVVETTREWFANFKNLRQVNFMTSEKYFKLYDKMDKIIELIIKPGMSELEKEKSVHDYIVLNAKYDYDNLKNNTLTDDDGSAYGILINGTAVCEGYALATQELLNRVGLYCVRVGSVSMNHMWNMVKIDGKYYHLDTTWDDTLADGLVSYTYFNLTDDEMSKSHTWEQASSYPVCNTTYTIENVSINKTTFDLGVGGTDTLAVTILPTNAAYKNVIWTSSDATVAKVDTTGKVTALKVGTAIITATSVDESKTATCKVTVNPAINLDSEIVDKAKVWTIKFTQEVVLNEASKQSITVKDSKGSVVTCALSLGQDNKSIVVNPPTGGYIAGAKYVLTIGNGLQSKNGKKIKAAKTMNFIIKD